MEAHVSALQAKEGASVLPERRSGSECLPRLPRRSGVPVTARQDRIRRQMAGSAAEQAKHTEGERTPGEVERLYAVASRCECHGYEKFRCAVVQGENAA